jgi:hypothetical protein
MKLTDHRTAAPRPPVLPVNVDAVFEYRLSAQPKPARSQRVVLW